ncbi:endonuclease/exonuclease/phosphatase family protein [Nocardia sputi]|uniref:endonuclease/exonuclease/phosphatase family protein n=1 Tax=Nocardia sputi TaxID=2943705 RepID=UPI0020C08C74|nr:endonuclease/exonuclease/phosphatase family protein [Nocardia sputi]
MSNISRAWQALRDMPRTGPIPNAARSAARLPSSGADGLRSVVRTDIAADESLAPGLKRAVDDPATPEVDSIHGRDLPELAAARGFGSSSATDPRRPLRTGTWNVAGLQTIRSHGMWDYSPRDVDYFAKVLNSVHPPPDVLLFQEGQVSRAFNEMSVGRARSDLRELAKSLGYPHIHETVISRSHMSADQDLSMAIMSKLPFEQTWARRIPDPDLPLTLFGEPVDPLPRYVQGATVSGITVVNAFPIPLGVLGHDYETSGGAQHATEIAETLRSMIKGPTVIGGDINTARPEVVYKDHFDDMGLSAALPPGTKTVPGWDGSPDQVYSTREFATVDSLVVPTRTDHHLILTDLAVTDPDLLEALSRTRQAQP